MMGLRQSPWRRTEIRWAAILFAGVAALFVFAQAGSAIVNGQTLAFDRAVLLALRHPSDLATPVGPGWLRNAIEQITAIGSITVLSLIALLTAGSLAVAGRARLALFTVAAMAGGASAAASIKLLFGRSRPDVVPHLVDTNSFSFPSEHSADSAVVFLILAALVARSGATVAQKRYVTVVACALTFLIGFSRLYLGVHYPTDVLAGWLIGALWGGATAICLRKLPI